MNNTGSKRAKLLLLALLSAFPVTLHAEDPIITGYITRIVTPTQIEVEGVPVHLTSKTIIKPAKGASLPQAFYLGETIQVEGTYLLDKHYNQASLITLAPVTRRNLSGFALIESVDLTTARFRADGREFTIPANLTATFPLGESQPLTLADLHTNLWLKYTAVQQEDGVVMLKSAELIDNVVSKLEAGLIANENKTQKPTVAAVYFGGYDARPIPNYTDPVMQARVDRIGNSLVPEYQKALPLTDPTRIPFRFQLVDRPLWHEAWNKAGGIILIPHQLVERLQDDSQLAALIADNMASILEKHSYFHLLLEEKLLPVDLIGDVTGIFVPGVFIATQVADARMEHTSLSAAQAQSGRVSLALMQAAGYDLSQAPEAWWTLATKPGKDPHSHKPPASAANLYDALGTTWRNTPLTSPQQASATLQ